MGKYSLQTFSIRDVTRKKLHLEYLVVKAVFFRFFYTVSIKYAQKKTPKALKTRQKPRQKPPPAPTSCPSNEHKETQTHEREDVWLQGVDGGGNGRNHHNFELYFGEFKKIAEFPLKITQFFFQSDMTSQTQQPLIQRRYFFKIFISCHPIILFLERF